MKKTALGILVVSLLSMIMIISIPVQAVEGTPTLPPTYTFYPTYTQPPTYTFFPTYTPYTMATKPEAEQSTRTPQSQLTETPIPLRDYPTALPGTGTLSNPVPQFTRGFTDYRGKHLAVMAMAAYKGPAIDELLAKAYDYKAAPVGMLDAIVYISVDYLDGQGDEELTFLPDAFATVTNKKEIAVPLFDDLGAVEPRFSGSVYSGGIVEGWIRVRIFQTDVHPLLKFQPNGALLEQNAKPLFFTLDNLKVYKP